MIKLKEYEILSFEIVSNLTLSKSLTKKLLRDMGRNDLVEKIEQKEDKEKIKSRFDILDL